jgi:hypothetical protein
MSETTSGIAPSARAKNLFDKLLGENPIPTVSPRPTIKQLIDIADAVHNYDETDIALAHTKTTAEMEATDNEKPTHQLRKTGRRQQMLRKTVEQTQTTEPVVITPIPNVTKNEISHRIGVTASPTETTEVLKLALAATPTEPLNDLGIAPRGLDHLPVSTMRANEIAKLMQDAVPNAQKIAKNATGQNLISRFFNRLQNKD